MLPLTVTLPQGSRQRDTRWQFAFTYCPPFPMRCPCPTLALALTTKFACHVAKFRRAKKVKSAAWKVGKRWRCQAQLSSAQQMLRQAAAVRECGSQRSAVVSLGQTHENELKLRATRRQRKRKIDWWSVATGETATNCATFDASVASKLPQS